jgi:hypothetical protein
VLGIEVLRQRGKSDEVGEDDGDPPPLGGRAWCDRFNWLNRLA